MCGPFVLAQLRPGERGVLRRLSGWLLLPYQLGRLTTYTLLGALGGAIGAGFVALTGFRAALGVLLAIGASLFLLQAVRLLAPRLLPAGSGRSAAPLLILATRVAAPLLRDPAGWRGYALGLALGLLPCGFLYSALVAAAGAGSASAGAVAMAAFALGTGVSLVAVGAVGRLTFLLPAGFASRLAGVALLVNAAVMGAFAVALL
jgi:sulfite exporter TauE/SafE